MDESTFVKRIIRNRNKLCRAFDEIIEKYGRTFTEDEPGGLVVSLCSEDEGDCFASDEGEGSDEGGSAGNTVTSITDEEYLHGETDTDHDDDDDSNTHDMLYDASLCTRLHQEVIKVKKELCWDEEEKEERSRHPSLYFGDLDSAAVKGGSKGVHGADEELSLVGNLATNTGAELATKTQPQPDTLTRCDVAHQPKCGNVSKDCRPVCHCCCSIYPTMNSFPSPSYPKAGYSGHLAFYPCVPTLACPPGMLSFSPASPCGLAWNCFRTCTASRSPPSSPPSPPLCVLCREEDPRVWQGGSADRLASRCGRDREDDRACRQPARKRMKVERSV